MIDLFIIHSGSDSDYVLKKVVPALVNKEGERKGHTNVLLLGSEQYKGKYAAVKETINNPDNYEVLFTGANWKKEAKKCIKKARAVLVIVGDDTEKKKASVGFEVAYARKQGKLILMNCISSKVKIPSFLKEHDAFTGKVKTIAEPQALEQIRTRIDNFDLGNYNVFNDNSMIEMSYDKEYISRLMEQYTMYQKTSEDLVARRQSVSSFYVTANSAFIAVSGMVMGLLDYPNNIFVIISMAVVGVILDVSWIKILDAYGALNAAKMKVISMIEQELPVRLYDTEWDVMSDKLNRKKYVSFTDSEKRIPKIFMCVYSLLLIVASVLAIINYI